MLPLSHNGDDATIVPLPSFNDLVVDPKQDQDRLLPFSLINFPSSPLYIYTEEDNVLFFPPALTDCSFPDNKFDVLKPSKQLWDIDELMTANNAKGEHCHQETIAKQFVPKKRSSKKDRSKIKTTQGLRDRRVRLSVGVAREFFHLQDMLRFNTASKTVAWLLTQSKSAIEDISNDFNHDNRKLTGEASNTVSEYDAVSGDFNETIVALDDESQRETPEAVCEGHQSQTSLKKVRRLRSQPSARRISSTHIARESRKKARARAKERTREKLLTRKLNGIHNNGLDDTAETGEEASRTSQLGRNDINSLLSMQQVQSEVVDESKQMQAINEETTTEDSLATSTSTTGNNLQNLWIFQENQFKDLESYVMPWEADNEWHFV